MNSVDPTALPPKRIRALTAPLIERNPDIVLTGSKYLCLLPVGHIARQIRIYDRSVRGYFTLEWRLTGLYVREGQVAPPAYGRPTGLVGRSRKFKPKGEGGIWDWDDPTMPLDFIYQVETEVLPLLRSLNTFEKIITFILGHYMMGYSVYNDDKWLFFTEAALGQFEDAKKRWSIIGPRLEDQLSTRIANFENPRYLLSDLSVGEALMKDDRLSLSKLLWENERGLADIFKLGRYWQPTAFPFQQKLGSVLDLS
ncbi:hypothetical protein MKL09_16100 [Methylobacterium sp. J-048]|uniref:hypothetical protein n=1 Tax=Methylobacterium sp. J-048 TaxID=2836635 RepID=UPI001FBB915C|nr:hypothetical protein [Methylobacterium sp. J-048]MCJ2058075.1 hypothetical protein [Methylobacterium sp. J-048]